MRPGLALAAALGGLSAVALIADRPRRIRRQLQGAREALYAMPPRWFKARAPREERNCYRRKTDALNVFRERNQDVIDAYGGESYAQSPAEFDALNVKYGLRRGGRQVRSIAEALWVAMPSDPPYCLSRIDIDALNETSPGREHPVGFQLPNFIYEDDVRRAEADWYRSRYEDERVPF